MSTSDIEAWDEIQRWKESQAAVDAVHAELPEAVPLDKWASDDIDDDVVRLAAQLLFVDQRDANHGRAESVQD
ncbi:hypothetical protein [Micromonospora sp. Llam0]|uniref:hypothetical protein n=1 Tax=Micromonospora sp. Llam0 TaxID=2485143 RepID=UPI000F46F94D|nr:hypothetical protein [Micromonospora sp. Llam0]